MKKISVVMAVYNGEKYLNAQIESILSQLSQLDELIVSVDPSSDYSAQIVSDFADHDSRIHLLAGSGQGVIKNFENALVHVTGDYIFLSDQDDIWKNNKVSVCINRFESSNALLVMHDATVTDSELNIVSERLYGDFFPKGIFRNIIKNRYIGCCMAFRKELMGSILPFPDRIPMHDQWIALVAEKTGRVEYIEQSLISYRRHKNTVTGNSVSSFFQKLKWRIQIFFSLIRAHRSETSL